MNRRVVIALISLCSFIVLLLLIIGIGLASILLESRNDARLVAINDQTASSSPQPSSAARPPLVATQTPEPVAPIAPVQPAPEPQQPAAPACPSGSVDFAVYWAELAPLYGVDGSISGYGAAVVVTATNNTSAAIRIESQAGAWGVDAAGNRIVPVPTTWGTITSNILPGAHVAGSGQNNIVTPEQGAAVSGWASNATGYVIVNWLTVQPDGCPARPAVTG